MTHTKTAARTKLHRLYVLRSEDYQVNLDDNASINIFPVEIDLRTNIFAGYFHDVSDLLKNDDCACQKSLAIRTDWGSFQIILACFAFTAILGHYTA